MKKAGLIILLVLAAMPSPAQNSRKGMPADNQGAPVATAQAMSDWQAMRFGMFIHWGPVSLKGTEIGWSRTDPPGRVAYKRIGVPHQNGKVPTVEYDNLYKQFNPVKFDAKAWVALAKAAGMKYMVFTTKHHDGFCEWDTKTTDYKITKSPFGRDVVKEYSDAVHAAGLKLGFYYSPPDFHHPDFLTNNHKRYVEYMHAQVRELMTNYGKVDILWFDGLGGTPEDWNSVPLIKMVRELQPGIVINNRSGLPQDFDTPEQRIGAFQNTRPWETCMTICRQWAYKPDDTMKSLDQCIQTLVSCACGDGNLLFNVGPMPTGEIEPRQVDRLKEMGAWMQKYGGTIYGTHGGPFLLGRAGGSTHKGNTVWLHVFKWTEDSIELPIPAAAIRSAKLLSSSSTPSMDSMITPGDRTVKVTVPKAMRDVIDTIIELELATPADGIQPVSIWKSGALSMGKKAKASNVYQKRARDFGPEKAVDDDEGTRWATDGDVKQATLEVDLGKEETIAGFCIREIGYPRVSAFTVDVQKGKAWEPVFKGKKIGKDREIKLPAPVQARQVRLNITGVTEGGPTIEEFQVLGPKKDQ